MNIKSIIAATALSLLSTGVMANTEVTCQAKPGYVQFITGSNLATNEFIALVNNGGGVYQSSTLNDDGTLPINLTNPSVWTNTFLCHYTSFVNNGSPAELNCQNMTLQLVNSLVTSDAICLWYQ